MDRSDQTGLAVAVVGHALLLAVLSATLLARQAPVKPLQTPIDVSLVDEVGLVATAPQSTVPPAESRAPDPGPPEDAAAPEPSPPAPIPAPPVPQPKAAPPPKPVEITKPAPPQKTAAAAKPAPDRTPPKRQAAPESPAKAAQKPSTGTSATAAKPRPRGSRLGDDFLKGLTDQPSTSKSTTPRAARIDAQALAGIQDAIRRQIQPCADRQVNPGPGANAIVTTLNLRLNPDGTLAATPTVVRQTGMDDENSRYSRRVIDLGIAAFKGCAPLKLPSEFYQTANGGWNNINYNWQLR